MIQKLKSLKHLLVAFLANIIYRFPSRRLIVVGVTGTDGKTTTVNLIYEILRQAGRKTASISTIGAKIGEIEIDTGLHTTTPDPFELQRLVRLSIDAGCKYLVLESSSHSLDQHRVFGVNFSVGVVTNVTHDHLDYHKTYDNYLKAKSKLFRNVKIAVLNKDDKSFPYLKSVVPEGSKIVTYGIKSEADFTPLSFKFKTPFSGQYDKYNCLAAIVTTSSLGIPQDTIRKAVASFRGIIGRMEEIKKGQNFRVIVDFAKTANGLKNALETLRSQLEPGGSLITVFGSAGLRDVLKRVMMGEVAAHLADVSVLTAEDPRTEDLNGIIEEIARGCRKASGVEGKTFFRVPDRREAINFAIKLARKGDIVVICGKGHERSMCIGKTEYPWSDQEESKKALKERLREK